MFLLVKRMMKSIHYLVLPIRGGFPFYILAAKRMTKSIALSYLLDVPFLYILAAKRMTESVIILFYH